MSSMGAKARGRKGLKRSRKKLSAASVSESNQQTRSNLMTPFAAETLGTALLVTLGNGVVSNVVLNKTKGNGAGWIVITFGWGMAVFIAVFCVADISGAHLNPAVTIGLAAGKKLAWGKVPSYLLAQMLGGFIGAL